ncbi:hypothetical protein GCM10022380_84850 [Amycolatopsis tucumanensis]|uniref:Uncharacterized protein n=1 Tax=Amycolatopsis tucumanensis TaxID=401106 RepID=A0ABP7JU92_9PSEU
MLAPIHDAKATVATRLRSGRGRFSVPGAVRGLADDNSDIAGDLRIQVIGERGGRTAAQSTVAGRVRANYARLHVVYAIGDDYT